MRRQGLVVAAVVAAMVLAGACGSGGDDGSRGDAPGERIRSTAALTITEPATSAQVPAGTVTVRLELEGGRIVPQTTKTLRPDEGHIHLSLDGSLVSMNYELTQALEVEPGKHVLQAEYVAGDHGPFDPRVVAATTFEAT